MIETFLDLGLWFRERLEDALDRRGVQADEGTRSYLVELMSSVGAGRRQAPGAVPLALQLAEAHSAPSTADRVRLYRAVGDEALCMTGFFADHLERRGVSADYVRHMGGGAYESAALLAAQAPSVSPQSPTFRQLARRFDTFAAVLDEVRESTVLRTPQDIVRLYDRWRRTRSPRLAERLCAEGVMPVAAGEDTMVH
jgi:hypothetical protein